MKTKALLCGMAVALCFPASASTPELNLIPQPKSVVLTSERRVAPADTVETLLTACPADSLLEWYSLTVTPERVAMEAYTPQGLVWAKKTLRQLADDNGLLPTVEITDYPEFPIRSFMYDSGRNFVEIDQIKHFIDLMSDYKLNLFHWHLTDKPAWRIECRAYPQLNDPQFQRIGRDEGRFYTYDEIRDVIAYARERGVTIMPEIDMPGHSDFFNATFGFPMNSPEGMQVLQTCLEEFFAEIPLADTPYLHIGSDEVHIDNPKEFMAWALGVTRDNGRIPMVWDPGLPADSATIYQLWRDNGVSDAAESQGKRFVDSAMGYLNYVDPMMFTNRMFLHSPCYTGHRSEAALGGILCLWNDVRVIDNTRIEPHNGMMGGLLPFAERFWNGGQRRSKHADVLHSTADPDVQLLVEFQSKMLNHKNRFLQEELQWWQPNRPQTAWDVELYNEADSLVGQLVAYGDVVDLDALCALNGITDATFCRASRSVEVPNDTVVMARIGFDAAARSNRKSDGIALQGEFENFGTVTVNGQKVMPPVWEQPGMYRFHFNTWAKPEEELAYTDEQFYWMRRPSRVALQKGTNTVTLTVRRHFPGQRFQFAILDLP